jgi:hypothetical protein
MLRLQCPRCLYYTNQSNNLKRHIEKQNNCNDVSGTNIKPTMYNYLRYYYCETCEFRTNIKKEGAKHYKNNPTHDPKNNYSLQLTNHQQQPLSTQNTQLTVIAPVIAPVNNGNINNGNINNNNNSNVHNNSLSYNNNNNNVNVKRSPYNSPDIGHLISRDFEECMRGTEDHYYKYIPNLIKKIHFNPDKPENHNIYMDEEESKVVNVYNGSSWTTKGAKNFIGDFVEMTEMIMGRYFEANPNQLLFKRFNKYIYARTDEDLSQNINDEVRKTLCSQKHILQLEQHHQPPSQQPTSQQPRPAQTIMM